MHQGRVHGGQRLQGRVLGGDPCPLRRSVGHLGIVMKRGEKVVQGIRRRPGPMYQSPQARIAGQDAHVFDALAACGLDQHDGMQLVELAIAPVPLAQGQPSADDLVETQRQERLGDQGQPRARRQIHRLRGGFEDERQDALAHADRTLPRTTRAYDTTPAPCGPPFTKWVHDFSDLARSWAP